MYRPPAFIEDRPDVLRAAIRAHPLAVLITYGASGLVANLIPFILGTGAEGVEVLQAHLAKGNAQLADLRSGAEALVVFQGPQAYISPSWYETKRQHGKAVPTWNYVTVQVRGAPRVLDDAPWLHAHVAALSAQQEAGFASPWSVEDAPEAFIAGQLKGITGVEIPLTGIEGKWKTSQNQPEANRAGVVTGLRAAEPGCPMAALVETDTTA